MQYNTVAPGKQVATVTVTNAPVNALNERAIDELVLVTDYLARDDNVVAVVFTGQGTSSFVAGADIRQMLEEIHSVEDAMVLPNNAHLAFRTIGTHGASRASRSSAGRGAGRRDGIRARLPLSASASRWHGSASPKSAFGCCPGYGGTSVSLVRLLADPAPRRRRGAMRSILILGGRALMPRLPRTIGALGRMNLVEGAHLECAFWQRTRGRCATM